MLKRHSNSGSLTFLLLTFSILCLFIVPVANVGSIFSPSRSSESNYKTTKLHANQTNSLSANWEAINPNPNKPWMSLECMKLLEGVIASVGGHNAVALEYGMGGSSLHFSALVKRYYAVEGNPEFYADVTNWDRLPENGFFVLRERNKLFHENDKELFREHPLFSIMEKGMASKPPLHSARYNGFESYILQASRFEDTHFDFILIDGFARVAVAFFVLDFIDLHSRVVIHDFFTSEMEDFLLCDLLEYYRIDGALNRQSPYISGGSVIVLQKRSSPGVRLSHSQYGDIVDDALHQFGKCNQTLGH